MWKDRLQGPDAFEWPMACDCNMDLDLDLVLVLVLVL